MQNKHIKILSFLFCVCILLQKTSIAQTEPDSTNYRTDKAVIIYVGGGMSYFIGKAGTPAGFDADVKKLHPIGSLRLMWHPGHLLHAGIETGWLRFYSY